MLEPFDCYPIAHATRDDRIMDVLDNYTCIRCEVETNVPDTVIASLRSAGQIRRVLDQASDQISVLKAKSSIMMKDFLEVKKHCPLIKVCGCSA